MPIRSVYSPLQLAERHVSIELGAALLVLRTGCSVDTGRRQMKRAYEMMNVPVSARLEYGARKAAADACAVAYGPVEVGTDKKGRSLANECNAQYVKVQKMDDSGCTSTRTVPVQNMLLDNRSAIAKGVF